MSDFWISSRPVPVDVDGPVDVPFEPSTLRERSIVSAFEKRGQRYPARIAAEDGKTRATFAEVLGRVSAIRNAIHSLDLPEERPILAVLNNDVEATIVIMAVLASGRPLIALDALATTARQVAILEAADASLLIAPRSAALPSAFASLRRLDPDQGSATFQSSEVNRDALSIIGFTSGSTTRPRGVAWSERQIGHMVSNFIDCHHIGENDRLIGLAPPSSGGVLQSIVALTTGAKYIPIELKAEGMMDAVARMIAAQPTVLFFAPSPLRRLLEIPGFQKALTSLRILNLGGEILDAETLAFFRSVLPANCLISVGFGNTEGGALTHWFVREDRIRGRVPIGYLERGRRVSIQDENGNATPAGEVGELVISDPGVAYGLWQHGMLISETVPVDGQGNRTYRSGDMVMLRPDDLFEFVGRKDRMLKINGLQVNLGDVEAAIATVDKVRECATIATQADGQHRVVAFVVAKDGAELDLVELRHAVRERAADHMVPSRFVMLPALPRLSNGKIDLVSLAKEEASSR